MDWLSKDAQANLRAQGQQLWIDNLPQLVDEVLSTTNSQALEPIYGGKGGALIKISSSRGQHQVLKLLPPSLAVGQITASKALSGQSFPRVYHSDIDDGWIIIEFLDGQPCSKNQVVDFAAALTAINKIWQQPLTVYQHSFHQLFSAWLLTEQEPPPELQELRALVPLLASAASIEPWHHLHGDFGIHNLFRRSSGELIFIDPAGVVGPRSWDLGSLVAWGGADQRRAYDLALDLAKQVNANPIEVLRWALVRIIASTLLSWQRGNYRQSTECQQAAELILSVHGHLLLSPEHYCSDDPEPDLQ